YGARLRAVTSGHPVDFTGILAGAYLVGTPGLYNVDANLAVQRRLAGEEDPARVFPRWPYIGTLMRPLSYIPYRDAVRIWIAIDVLAFTAFIFLFPMVPRWVTAVAVCWSIPVFDALGEAQDSPLLLVYLSVSLLLHRAGMPFAAGFALAMCAPKYHIFIL